MTKFAVFALYLSVSAAILIVWPVMIHPTLSSRRKILLSTLTFFVLVPVGLVLYAWLGVPQMAVK